MEVYIGEEVGGREGERRKGRDGWMEGERQERGRREGGGKGGREEGREGEVEGEWKCGLHYCIKQFT